MGSEFAGTDLLSSAFEDAELGGLKFEVARKPLNWSSNQP